MRHIMLFCFLLLLGACADQPVRVTFETDMGAFVAEVYPDRAPRSAAHFLALVESGAYESHGGFYRVVRPDNDNGSPVITVIQGGLLDDGPAEGIRHEPTGKTGLRHIDGALSLARGAVGTGSAAAFFIVLGDQPSLDEGGLRITDGAGFAVFGQVTKGMDVIRRINALTATAPVEDAYVVGQILANPVRFTRVERLE